MIEPYSPAAVQPCSYDVHLGPNAKIETKSLDDLTLVSEERPYFIGPGVFMLGETVEYVRLPNNVEAHLHLVILAHAKD